jgi:hypothetical protein
MTPILPRAPLAAAILALLAAGQGEPARAQGDRIEGFRTDLTAAEVEMAKAIRTQSLASSAYIWGIPPFLNLRLATEFKLARRAIAPDQEPFAGWMLIRNLSTPQTDNAMPNVDTLYGASFVLLDRQGPVILSTPEVRDRYFSVALHDAYFNVFAVLGTRDGGRRARYLIVPPGWKGQTPADIDRIIEAPTKTIAAFQRVFTRGGGDLAAARGVQDHIIISPAAGGAAFPRIETPEFDVPTRLRDTSDPLAFFRYVDAYTAINPPSEQYAAMVVAFQEVGLGPGARLPESARLRDAISVGAREGKKIIDAAISAETYRKGWRIPDPRGAKAGPYVLAQAVLQITQIGSLPVSEAVYYVGRRDAHGAPLDGRHDYTLTFPRDALPPVMPEGFWSVTMYKASDSLLVANEIDRYVLRPSTPGLTMSPDGSLTIRISHGKPAEGLGNWLPAPRDGFLVVLRAYLPQKAISDGTWFPPAISRERR